MAKSLCNNKRSKGKIGIKNKLVTKTKLELIK